MNKQRQGTKYYPDNQIYDIFSLSRMRRMVGVSFISPPSESSETQSRDVTMSGKFSGISLSGKMPHEFLSRENEKMMLVIRCN